MFSQSLLLCSQPVDLTPDLLVETQDVQRIQSLRILVRYLEHKYTNRQ